MAQEAQQHSYLSQPTWFVHYYNSVFDQYDQAGPFFSEDDAQRFADRDCCMFEDVEVVAVDELAPADQPATTDLSAIPFADVQISDAQHADLVARVRTNEYFAACTTVASIRRRYFFLSDAPDDVIEQYRQAERIRTQFA